MKYVLRWMGLGALGLVVACGSSKKKGEDPADTDLVRSTRFLTVPNKSALAGTPTKYRAAVNQPGATVSLTKGPPGARVDEAGNVTWTPADTDVGDQTFELTATVDGQPVMQQYVVKAARPVVQAERDVDPISPHVVALTVEAPLSKVRGAAIQIPPGAMPPTVRRVTISRVDQAPVPVRARVAQVPPSELIPVEFGPAGTVFRRPVRVQLPASTMVLSKGRPRVATYDYDVGEWKDVPVLSVDLQTNTVLAEISHFSTYVVIPGNALISSSLSLGGAGTACADALLVRAPMAVDLSQIPSDAINGWQGGGAGVRDVLTAMPAGMALQVYFTAEARSHASATSQRGFLLMSASKGVNGLFTIHATSDRHAAPFLTVPSPLAATDPALEEHLTGRRAHFLFSGLGPLADGVDATVAVSFFMVPAVDADLPPTAVANPIDSQAVRGEALIGDDPTGPGFDGDCDQAPDKWDPAPAGTPPPGLIQQPPSPLRAVVGAQLSLSALPDASDVMITWSASHPSLNLVAAGTGATIAPTLHGLFRVEAVGRRGDGEARVGWDIAVDPASIATSNTPPSLQLAASTLVVRAGESLHLTAVGHDAEQTDLDYSWSVAAPGKLSALTGQDVIFSATTPGDYNITGVANDGVVPSPPARLIVTVLSFTANRPPSAPVVSPAAAILTRRPGETLSLGLLASAFDPDGDMITMSFSPEIGWPAGVSLSSAAATGTLSASVDGVFVFWVDAVDTHGARGPATPVKIQIVPELSATASDADGDGYPVGFDCDDADRAIFPGAAEICGDQRDQNCDGMDTSAAACDLDGDRFNPSQGDCDDQNPARNPGMIERCDGHDNDCDGLVDEGFASGEACSNGVGVCEATGFTACSANATGVVCGAMTGPAGPETCDGRDNDCNGLLDDVPGALGGGNLENCGGCGLACTQPANTAPACLQGGCAAPCKNGYVNADGRIDNGCECALSTGGVEACDGRDNDCNGQVDDGVSELVYGGPAGTLGIGACRSGARICSAGVFVQAAPPVLPAPEVCDGSDNDCDGMVDEDCGPPPPMGPPSMIATCPTPDGPMCTDLLRDNQNCGMCGRSCGATGFCDRGTCINKEMPPGSYDGGVPPIGMGGDSCPSFAVDRCGDGQGNQFCTNLKFDDRACGVCGNVCGSGTTCVSGMCKAIDPGCQPTRASQCAGVMGNGCTNLTNDPANCGGCGIACKTGGTCQSGVCQGGWDGDGGMAMPPPMPPPLPPPGNSCPPQAPNACGGGGAIGFQCVNLLYDAQNCGQCGKACAGGAVCEMGACQQAPDGGAQGGPVSCPASIPSKCMTTLPSEFCADLQTDLANCGSCGQGCSYGSTCKQGVCEMACPAGQGVCAAYWSPYGSSCFDFGNDNSNCGGCGHYCPGDRSCTNGVCAAVDTGCFQGQPDACPQAGGGQQCVNFLWDQRNCGQCGNICPNNSMCQSGTCYTPPPPPPPPPIMCGSDMPNACVSPTGMWQGCSNWLTDRENCGGCRLACAANEYCVQGVCGPDPGGSADGGISMCPATAVTSCVHPNGPQFCTDLNNDAANCGGCGRACSYGFFCQAGTCKMACGEGGGQACPNAQAPGGQMCVAVSSDNQNCGACGVKCAVDSYCSGGACVPVDTGCGTEMPSLCPAPGGGQYCVNRTYNRGHCGTCGRACASDEYCQSGTCFRPQLPPPPTMNCHPAAPNSCNGMCIDMMRDRYNCGGCSNACMPGLECIEGGCIDPATAPGPIDGGVSCPASIPSQCNQYGSPYCANLQTDAANCGMCGMACAVGGRCELGVCQGGTTMPPMMPPGMMEDPYMCPSTAAMSCRRATGQVYCANPASDAANCGGCGVICPAGVLCTNGSCGGNGMPGPGTCPAELTMCSFPGDPMGKIHCTDLKSDPGNCGACGTTCGTGTACVQGKCERTGSLVPGLFACGSGADMVCTAVYYDNKNCGGCGIVCGPGTYCQGGRCAMPPQCPAELKTCMDPGGFPMCTDTLRDPRNCGMCGKVCAADTYCDKGACVAGQIMPPSSCPPMLKVCPSPMGDQCTDPTKDQLNCGACGIVCAAGTFCNNGACMPEQTMTFMCSILQTPCPGATGPYCSDLKYDPMNCGMCGRQCPAVTPMCMMGMCL